MDSVGFTLVGLVLYHAGFAFEVLSQEWMHIPRQET